MTASMVSPAECAAAYERCGRHLNRTARLLGISPTTARARLRAHHGSAEKVPKAPLRSSSAAIGRAFEHRVRDVLTAAGWWVVRAAGSKGEADLVAFARGRPYQPFVLLVNVKRGGAVPVQEWNALYDLAAEVGGKPVIAFQRRGGGIEWRTIVGSKTGARGKRQPWTGWSP